MRHHPAVGARGAVRWWLADDPERVLTAQEIVATVSDRAAAGVLCSVLESDTGLLLHVVTNRERAMVMLLAGPEDAGGHAVDPSATGTSGGYLLDNGQEDEYADGDTVPLDEALRVVDHIVVHGTPPLERWRRDA